MTKEDHTRSRSHPVLSPKSDTQAMAPSEAGRAVRAERWTPRNVAIARRCVDGEPMARIAQDHGLSRQRVEQIARAYGLPKRCKPKQERERRMTHLGNVRLADRNRSILALLGSGLGLSEIAGQLKLPRSTVKGVFERYHPLGAKYATRSAAAPSKSEGR